jgi:hypothetical protein
VGRFIAPAGDLTLSRDAVIEDSGVPDAIEEDAKEGPVEQLPNDTGLPARQPLLRDRQARGHRLAA